MYKFSVVVLLSGLCTLCGCALHVGCVELPGWLCILNLHSFSRNEAPFGEGPLLLRLCCGCVADCSLREREKQQSGWSGWITPCAWDPYRVCGVEVSWWTEYFYRT